MKAKLLRDVLDAREARRGVVRLLWVGSGEERLVDATAAADLPNALREAVDASLLSDKACLVDSDGASVFVHPVSPSLRLAIVGAVHIAQRLSLLAQDLGYQVTVIDPRRGFLTEARFPGVERCFDWPDVALERFAPDARSAVVTLSHDAKIDEPALEVALRSDCFYVGALGSKRTQARRKERLVEAGVASEALARVHGPVGLDLGAKSPAEIALSIAAELTATLRGKGRGDSVGLAAERARR